MIDTEVLIVGGGPAGSSCAWKLREGGRDVTILDKQAFPRTKLCAGWITPEVLLNLGLTPESYPHGIVTLDRLHARFFGFPIPFRTKQYSIRRYEFDNFLLKRSGAALHRHAVKDIHRKNDRYIVDDSYRCKFLIGAGGTYCPVYCTFFKEAHPRIPGNLITTMEEEFAWNAEDRNCYLWFSERKLAGYSWYVPKDNGFINVGIGGKFDGLKKRGETIRRHWDFFTDKLRRRDLVRSYTFKPQGQNYYLRMNIQTGRIGNAFIIGDAAGLATLDVGEGIGPAIESGLLAADSILHGTSFSLDAIGKYSFYHKMLPWKRFQAHHS